MASPTQWTWVRVNSGSWWWTGRPGVLQSMGSQRVGPDWVTDLNWTQVQGILKSLLHHNLKASIFQHSAFFMVQLFTSIHSYWKKHSFYGKADIIIPFPDTIFAFCQQSSEDAIDWLLPHTSRSTWIIWVHPHLNPNPKNKFYFNNKFIEI